MRAPITEIVLNGLPFPVDVGTRLDVLLDCLREGAGLTPSFVAVDRQYVPPEAWPDVMLRAGVVIETIE